jgi:hypothetical protein
MGAPVLASDRKEELLFVNKKKQKNFNRFSAVHVEHRAKRSKSFLVTFFQKSNGLPFALCTGPGLICVTKPYFGVLTRHFQKFFRSFHFGNP